MTVFLEQYHLSPTLYLLFSLGYLEGAKMLGLTASFLVAQVCTVVVSVTNPSLEDAASACARELIAAAARVI